MHCVQFLFSFFYFYYSTCYARTVENPNDGDIMVKPLEFTASPLKPSASDVQNASKNLLVANNINKKEATATQNSVKDNSKLSNEELLLKILTLILENKEYEINNCKNNLLKGKTMMEKDDVKDVINVEKELRNSNLLHTWDIDLDYYDAIESMERPRQVPINLESPRNGLLGTLHFKFDSIDNYRRQGKKQRKHGE